MIVILDCGNALFRFASSILASSYERHHFDAGIPKRDDSVLLVPYDVPNVETLQGFLKRIFESLYDNQCYFICSSTAGYFQGV